MIKHIVLLNWKEGVSQEQIEAVSAGFQRLGDEIEEVQTYEFGPDAGIYRDNASYGLVAEFASEEDLKTYVVHPKHQEFLSEIAGPMLESFQTAQFVMGQ